MTSAAQRRLLPLVLASAVICARLEAHDVVVEQIVRMSVAPQAGRVVVRLQIPVSLLNDAGLPRLDDGTVDPSASQAALQVVAADVTRNLDFRRDDVSLRLSTATAHVGSDRRTLDVELAYALDGRAQGLSARINAFQGTPLHPSRTDVSYQPPVDAPQPLTVTGPPIRVTFDPDLTHVARQFLVRTFDAVLSSGDHVLFLICLLLPVRAARQSARLVAALLAAQVAGMILSSMLATTSASLLPLEMVASSVVAAAALCGIAGATETAFMMLAGTFGLLSGITFGAWHNGIRELAGSHGASALVTSALVLLIAELWLGGVMVATRRWLNSAVRSDSIVTILGSALAGHVAIHRVLDRGHEIAQAGSFVAGHAVLLLTLAWTLVMTVLALSRFLRGSPLQSGLPVSGGAAL